MRGFNEHASKHLIFDQSEPSFAKIPAPIVFNRIRSPRRPVKRHRIGSVRYGFSPMPVRIVQSKQNARLKELRRALAFPAREGHGLAGIEGPNLIQEALNAGLRMPCVFAAQGFEHLLRDLSIPPDMEILLMQRELLDNALATQAPQPVAALVEPPDWTWAYSRFASRVCAADRDCRRDPGPRKPWHHHPLRRSVRRRRSNRVAGDCQSMESKSNSSVGRQRFSPASNISQHSRLLHESPRG